MTRADALRYRRIPSENHARVRRTQTTTDTDTHIRKEPLADMVNVVEGRDDIVHNRVTTTKFRMQPNQTPGSQVCGQLFSYSLSPGPSGANSSILKVSNCVVRDCGVPDVLRKYSAALLTHMPAVQHDIVCNRVPFTFCLCRGVNRMPTPDAHRTTAEISQS